VKAGLILLTVLAVNVVKAQDNFATAEDIGSAEWGSAEDDNSTATPDIGLPNIAGNPPRAPL